VLFFAKVESLNLDINLQLGDGYKLFHDSRINSLERYNVKRS
jgi:hypothetical protein